LVGPLGAQRDDAGGGQRSSMGMLSWAWVLGVVVFSFVRALIAWPTLGQFGVDPLTFLIIDLVTAPPYAIGQVKLVKSIVGKRWRQAQFWAFVVAAMFLAPYAYIVVAGSGEIPAFVYVILAVLVAVFGIVSILRIRASVIEARSAAG